MPLDYREIAPPAQLAPFVKCFWTLRGEGVGQPERILPDGSFELVFHFGDPFSANGERQPNAMLVGEIRRPTLITPSSHIDVLGVRFHVGGAGAFFREPLFALRDAILPLTGWDAAFDHHRIEEMLLARLEPPDRWWLAREVSRLITRRRGRIGSRQLLQITGRAERTIERAFEDCVGMSAKTFARLTRFHAYVADPRDDHGYFDDSHLHRDFNAFAGTSPSRFRQEMHAIDDAFRNSE